MNADGRILIVGAGPVGLTMAILLRLRGFDPVVIERRRELVSLPQAHVINMRSMEIFEEIGVAAEIRAAARTLRKTRNVVWAESLAGREFGRIAAPVGNEAFQREMARMSHHVVANLAQNLLEPILLDRLRALGGNVEFGCAIEGLEQGDHIEVVIGGLSGEQRCRPACVLGCDGAGSAVRRLVGIPMEGPASLARFLTLYFEADLRDLVLDREGPLYWIAGPDVRGFFIWFDFEKTWAFLAPIGGLPAETFGEEAVRGILRKAIGSDRAIHMLGTSIWNMSAQVAERFSDGAVHLLGDAAHRFPPTGGLGLNTGVQDAHNLAWKMAAVRDGDAHPSLLASYEVERRPIAIRNCAQSVRNFERMTEVDDALGIPTLTPIAADAGDGKHRSWRSDHLGLDGMAPAPVAKRAAVAKAIDDQKGHFQISFGAQLGFRYEAGAAVPDGSEAPLDRAEVYVPVGRPGSRLPHFLLDGEPVHRLLSRRRMTLLTGSVDWRRVAAGNGLAVLPLPADCEATTLLGIGSDGALLVRPDGHVAWRETRLPADADHLPRAIGAILGRHAPAQKEPE